MNHIYTIDYSFSVYGMNLAALQKKAKEVASGMFGEGAFMFTRFSVGPAVIPTTQKWKAEVTAEKSDVA